MSSEGKSRMENECPCGDPTVSTKVKGKIIKKGKRRIA
jgi:hypothetical protein